MANICTLHYAVFKVISWFTSVSHVLSGIANKGADIVQSYGKKQSGCCYSLFTMPRKIMQMCCTGNVCRIYRWLCSKAKAEPALNGENKIQMKQHSGTACIKTITYPFTTMHVQAVHQISKRQQFFSECTKQEPQTTLSFNCMLVLNVLLTNVAQGVGESGEII